MHYQAEKITNKLNSDDMKDKFEHWDNVYKTKDHTQVSWHQEHSTISYDWIKENTNENDAIIDIGCGVSILADNLLNDNYKNISLLELSTNAIEALKDRLKKFKNNTKFYNLNILDFTTNDTFDLWHDRAVFHFLVDKNDQKTYIEKLEKYLNKGGYFLLATFAPDGPKECSELNIVQYDKEKITKLLSNRFDLIKTINEKHPHPNGSIQSFNYFLFRKK